MTSIDSWRHACRACGIGLALLTIGGRASHAQITVSLDSNQTHQSMAGWECTPFVADPCDPAFDAVRDTLIALAVEDIGIDRVRLEIRSGVENDIDYFANYLADGCPAPPDPLYTIWRENRYATVNDNDDPDLLDLSGFHFTELDLAIEEVILPMRSRVEMNGESLYVNLCYVAFTSQIVGGEYVHDDPNEYAEFVLAAYLHMEQTHGFVPDSWEILLEPDNVPHWNGTLLGQAMVATATKLAAAGYSPSFVAPSNASMAAAISYFDGMVAVPGAADHLREYSYHRYGGVSEANLLAIVARADQYGLDPAMLEWWFGNATYETLHQDLTLGRNSAWQGRTLRGYFDVDDSDPGNLIVEYNRDTKYNRQYFKYVRKAATRIGASSNDAGFEPIAFINDDGGWVVVVKGNRAGMIEFEGLPPGLYGVKYTTGAASQNPIEYDVDRSDILIGGGETLSTDLPDRGLVTVYRRDQPSGVGESESNPDLGWKAVALPNPTPRSVTIEFTAPQAGRVEISVYDTSGRRVRGPAPTIVTPGSYRIEWDTSAPTGVYLYEIHWNGRVVLRDKLVLQR